MHECVMPLPNFRAFGCLSSSQQKRQIWGLKNFTVCALLGPDFVVFAEIYSDAHKPGNSLD